MLRESSPFLLSSWFEDWEGYQRIKWRKYQGQRALLGKSGNSGGARALMQK
jgi:hypothetical protein